jgi:cbb3-type cytochrome oxidase subunit 3
MNLIKEYLGTIAGVHVFAIIAMLIFLVTFLFMIYHTYSLRKDEVSRYSRLPLEDEEKDQI